MYVVGGRSADGREDVNLRAPQRVDSDRNYYSQKAVQTMSEEREKPYVATLKDKQVPKFHFRDCTFGEHIVDSHYYIDFATREEAQHAGYRPCRVCEP